MIGYLLDAGATWRWVLIGEGIASLVYILAFLRPVFADIPDRENVRAGHLMAVGRFNPGLLVGLLVIAFLYAGVETSLNVWLPKSQIDTFGSSETLAGLTVTLFWAGMIAGRLVAMPMSRRYRPARIVTLCGAGLAIFGLAIAFSPTRATTLILSIFADSARRRHSA